MRNIGLFKFLAFHFIGRFLSPNGKKSQQILWIFTLLLCFRNYLHDACEKCLWSSVMNGNLCRKPSYNVNSFKCFNTSTRVLLVLVQWWKLIKTVGQLGKDQVTSKCKIKCKMFMLLERFMRKLKNPKLRKLNWRDLPSNKAFTAMIFDSQR